ncbi:DEAD/DEAH box helicase [Massilia brevitalea]|uniref:DEAD/DEAH box helicase n=1 Tax=Massilia brevitalea TaxID=442526 RepID=UPI002739546F
MKPSARARYAAAITLSKGKMYEYGVPLEHHVEMPPNLDLEMQFPLAIGTIGDFASAVNRGHADARPKTSDIDDLAFAAQVLQAFDESQIDQRYSFELGLLAAAAYFLADMPGRALVQARKLVQLGFPEHDELAKAIWISISSPWQQHNDAVPIDDSFARDVIEALYDHFQFGTSIEVVRTRSKKLVQWAYNSGTAHELLFSDLLSAIALTRVRHSAWQLLPNYSNISVEAWQSYLMRDSAIRDLWPSQRVLGDAGLYRGESAIIQMPTSAGKTRAIEIVIRSSFMSGRTNFAIIVAPFRALCQEISTDLENVFRNDNYRVNRLSDSFQTDYVAEVFGDSVDARPIPKVIVLTPEKLLYALRQQPELADDVGLIIFDEGHQFDTGARGITYELLLTSLKKILAHRAQTILISAVITNAQEMAAWLFSDNELVVSDQRLQSRRLVAFASFPPGRVGQLVFNVAGEGEQDFFVPRVISPQQLTITNRESVPRVFPTDKSTSIALYLAIKQIEHGAVAIYCSTKLSAAKVVRDAVEEVFGRDFALPPPSTHSDPQEIARFVKLYSDNFGPNSYLTLGASLGIFAHHANTPHGLRLAIEYAMRNGRIRLVVCTSTLAQGVNLPIRYLFITNASQGSDSIKPRDFRNLMGRVGRAGMHTEGTVIFTDPNLYDNRNQRRGSYDWADALKLFATDSNIGSGSSLLELLAPLENDYKNKTYELLSPALITNILSTQGESGLANLIQFVTLNPTEGFTTSKIIKQLQNKFRAVETVESFLMENQAASLSGESSGEAQELAQETLAHFLATEDEKFQLREVFANIAKRIGAAVPDPEVQARFGKTLLGIDQALKIDEWVRTNQFHLIFITSEAEIFSALSPLLFSLSSNNFIRDTTPADAILQLAEGWLNGQNYEKLLKIMNELGATYAYGKQRRKFNIDIVVGVCETVFSYEFPLYLTAIGESISDSAPFDEGEKLVKLTNNLQKRLKYGLPDRKSVLVFESGFAERIVAQAVGAEIWDMADTVAEVKRLIPLFQGEIEEVLQNYPSFFTDILGDIVSIRPR